MSNQIEGFLGVSTSLKKSRIPARLDKAQACTGIFLALFMWAHMFLVSSILVSTSFFNKVVYFLEARFIYDGPVMTYVTSFLAFCVLTIFFIHAALAMRKFPINFRQWQAYRAHMHRIKHQDTSFWWIQAITGFIMFFLGSGHLIIMITNAQISSAISSHRVVSHFMWLFYLVLLFCVELHGSIGLYRVAVKWGLFEGNDPKSTRAKLKKAKIFVSAFFIILGLLSLAAFIKIGISNLH